jgi:RING1 and YY1-binding protein
VITPAPSSSTTEEHFWDCSVCTYTNNAEAFKCSMCDVRKGTSTRKPKINPDLVASQLAQALTPPPPPITPTPSCSNSVQGDEDPYEFDDETTVLSTLKVNNKKNREQKSTKKKEPGSSKKSAANG